MGFFGFARLRDVDACGSGVSVSSPAHLYAVGDLVTRDGSDLHLVEWLSDDRFAGMFRCVQAPAGRWTDEGATESNLTRRYSFVRTPGEDELGTLRSGLHD